MVLFRTASGFLIFALALALERSGEPPATLAFIALSVSAGGFAASYLSPLLRARLGDEHIMLGLGSAVAALGVLVAATLQNVPTILGALLLLGLASTVGRHASDSVLQRAAADATRSRAFACYEGMLQLGWVTGALVATVALLDGRSGCLVAALMLTLGSIIVTRATYVRTRSGALVYASSASLSEVTSSASPSAAA
jgi:hypothetical protein